MNNKRAGGRLWGDVCREWWDKIAKMCVYAWQTRWLSGGKVGRLHKCTGVGQGPPRGRWLGG